MPAAIKSSRPAQGRRCRRARSSRGTSRASTPNGRRGSSGSSGRLRSGFATRTKSTRHRTRSGPTCSWPRRIGSLAGRSPPILPLADGQGLADRTWAVESPGETSCREGRDQGILPSGDRQGKNRVESEGKMGKGTVTGGDVAVYQERGGRVRLEVFLEGETVWLSLTQMADLFGRDKSVISRHLRSVFEGGELARKAVVARNATTATDGKTYQVE